MDSSHSVAVIGSSPIMLLYAIYLRSTGASVYVFEGEQSFGGAWKVDAQIDERMKIQRACHLIEFYPGVYRLIEQLSGIKFVVSGQKSFRFLAPSGERVPYATRFSIIKHAIARVLYLMKVRLRVRRDILLSRARHSSSGGQCGLLDEVRIDLRRIAFIRQFKGIEQPAMGYDNFVPALLSRLVSLGGIVVPDEISHIEFHSDKVKLRGIQDVYVFEKVFASQSLRLQDNEAPSEAKSQGRSKRQNYDYWLIAVRLSDLVEGGEFDYMHCKGHPIVNRISSAAGNHVPGARLFLVELRYSNVELRSGKIEESTVLDQLKNILTESKITHSWASLSKVANWSDSFLRIPQESNRWLNLGHQERMTIVPSMGDLAKNLALLQERKALPRHLYKHLSSGNAPLSGRSETTQKY
jgi:hypothetical protein